MSSMLSFIAQPNHQNSIWYKTMDLIGKLYVIITNVKFLQNFALLRMVLFSKIMVSVIISRVRNCEPSCYTDVLIYFSFSLDMFIVILDILSS